MSRALTLVLLATACGDSPSPPNPDECSTGEVWTGGNEESPLMHPGGDCIGCHESEGEGPHFTIAGTVMGDAAEPDDCYGVEGVTVRITGADEAVEEVVTNAAGNFFFSGAVAFPYNIEIERGGVTGAMAAAQSEGSCGVCHTEIGENGAPGRVVAP
jgi:hypothetical protein